MTTDRRAALVALDWGTTSLRAYLVDAQGSVLDERRSKEGIRNVRDRDFAAVFRRAVQGWDDGLPMITCGMIGSRNGWHEAPYCDAPAGVDALAAALARVPGTDLMLVPGVRHVDARGDADLMRGEETQLVGAMEEGGAPALFVHPGTHCKWAEVRDGCIERFSTWMTGELHAVLLGHSILGALQGRPDAGAQDGAPGSHVAGGDGFDWSAFDQGVARAQACDDFTHALFTARARLLEGALPARQVPEYLSGLLVGEELRGARATGWLDDHAQPVLIGEPRLVARYARAFERCGVPHRLGAADATVAGLLRVARAAGLVA